jgi:purine-nucleoside phosphorylase
MKYEEYEKIANHLKSNIKIQPKLGIIAGSGLGGLADRLEQKNEIPYSSIPNFPTSTVAGHAGSLVFGMLEGVPTVCMKGRFHAYEGYPLWKCAIPVRVMKLLGVKLVIVTNAAGGINAGYKPGDVMIIKDHISIPGFAGNNPLKGHNDERWGPRFPPMNRAYDLKYRQTLKEVARELKLDAHLKEGVYCMFGGPCYETVAEVKFIRNALHGDAVGMSTIHEVITAVHCGMKVLGISLITNACIADEHSTEVANHEEVVAVGKKRAADMEKLVSGFVHKVKHDLVD